ncbi:MAG: sensor histidine kinase, partial [SAR92 clade bacterium]
NPHFLFNTLNSISSLITKRDDSRANEMIIQLSDFLRHSLNSDPVDGISLKDEIDALKLYLRIEEARFGDRLSINININKGAEKVQVPGMILQPLVENSIKYAIAPNEEGGEITINATMKENMLDLHVLDSGPGFDKNLIDLSQSGVGLRNTRDRLNTFYQGKSKFKIESSDEGGTDISIKVPLSISGDSMEGNK